MRLRARVRRVTGATRHHLAHIEEAEVHRDEQLPPPAWLEIQSGDGAYYLLRFDERGECLADTWHQTLEQAKAQYEFEVGEEDWVGLDA